MSILVVVCISNFGRFLVVLDSPATFWQEVYWWFPSGSWNVFACDGLKSLSCCSFAGMVMIGLFKGARSGVFSGMVFCVLTSGWDASLCGSTIAAPLPYSPATRWVRATQSPSPCSKSKRQASVGQGGGWLFGEFFFSMFGVYVGVVWRFFGVEWFASFTLVY